VVLAQTARQDDDSGRKSTNVMSQRCGLKRMTVMVLVTKSRDIDGDGEKKDKACY